MLLKFKMAFIKRNKHFIIILVVLIIVALCTVADWPKGPDLDLNFLRINYYKELKFHLGLDLQGGTQLIYDLDLSKIPNPDKREAIKGVYDVIERRINAFGVTEPIIQTDSSGSAERIIIELPGLKNTEEAIALIGKTAQLEFKEQEGEIPKTPDGKEIPMAAKWKSTGLTGAQFKKAQVTFSPETGEPEIKIEFNNEGTKLFAELTKKNIGKPLAIFLDNELISAPTVQTAITDGNAVITGKFTVDEAKKLAIQLNAGALPVPLKLSEQKTIGATLGEESVKKSLMAGILGLFLVILFMIFYYRFFGFLSAIILFFYTVIVLAIFKLIPVTLTLGGIAGFILSIGSAAEANVLIFERIREELRKGNDYLLAAQEGFKGAWSSIWDSNVVSLIVCLILYWFGTGGVRGFAVTLFIGIVVSIFLVLTFTRSILFILFQFRWLRKPYLYAVKEIQNKEKL